MLERLRETLKRTLDRVSDWTGRLIDGAIELAGWRSSMARDVFAGHVEAYMKATGKTTLDDSDKARIADGLRFHLTKLNGFADDLSKRAAESRDLARAKMYAGGIKETYSRGDTAGYDLPGYPGVDVACMVNCKCEWQREDRDDGTVIFTWVRHASDSCEDCLWREREWSAIER